MNIAIAGDSAGETLASILTDHLCNSYAVENISHTADGPDTFYANLADRVGTAVLDEQI